MYRSDWDLISPSSWLSDFADEEAFFGGRDLLGQEGSTMLIILPETTQRGPRRGRGHRSQRREQAQQPQEQLESQKAKETKTPAAKQAKPSQEERQRQRLLDEDFFDGLPLGARQFETQLPSTLAPPKAKTKDGYSYLTYSYCTCATLDDKGEIVESTRRRYEDSAGVMKAVHHRQIGDRSMDSTWIKKSEKDEGKHDKSVSSGDVHEFLREWRATPFGIAEKNALERGEKKQTELPDAPPPQEIP